MKPLVGETPLTHPGEGRTQESRFQTEEGGAILHHGFEVENSGGLFTVRCPLLSGKQRKEYHLDIPLFPPDMGRKEDRDPSREETGEFPDFLREIGLAHTLL